MVVRFKSGKSIRGALIYNERKLERGEATLLAAVGFHKDAGNLHFYDKLKRLQRLAEKRPTTKHNCVHVSLNFSPKENLSKERLQEVAADYLVRMGFAGQPYLLYEHRDAGHQHVHIVTTNIQPNGGRIDLHHLVERESEPARKAIEQHYGLVRAEEQQTDEMALLRPADLTKAMYGREETKAEISRIVRTVAAYYKYESFRQYNAVLRLFNVEADPGEPGTRMHEHGGLAYRILDQGGNPVGNAIKASSIYDEPTLRFLRKRFDVNKRFYKDHSGVRNAIQDVLSVGKITPERFREKLEKRKIAVLFHRDTEGRIFGMTFIDHVGLCVYKGSSLGPQFSASNLLSRMDIIDESKEQQWNKLFVQETLHQTDFTRGFGSVLAGWTHLGLTIKAEKDTGGNVQFRLGHRSSQPELFLSAPDNIHSYLQQHTRSPLQINHYAGQVAVSGHVPVIAPMQTTLGILDRLMSSVDTDSSAKFMAILAQSDAYARSNSFVDPELLKEAKKKRKRWL